MIHLRGLTWAHTRGFSPLAALGRVWEDFHPDQTVTWDARSLWSFGEEPLEKYVDEYDFFVFDYPFAGEALERRWVHPLGDLLPASVLDERRRGTVGPLYGAFTVGDGQAALPIDLATHVAASRPDLLERLGEDLPRGWPETLDLARRTGRVAMPMRPTGVWGAFLTICASRGNPPFRSETAFETQTARQAVGMLKALAALVEPWCFETYPVALLNRMSASDAIAFVPLTYGYSVYGMQGYAPNRLAFHDARLGEGVVAAPVLGGAGLGVSFRSAHARQAAEHVAWLTSPEIQSGLYVLAGGQPAQRAAWDSAFADVVTNEFFSGTLASAENAYVRPNAPGFHDFQNFAAGILHRAVLGQEDVGPAVDAVAEAWGGLSGKAARAERTA